MRRPNTIFNGFFYTTAITLCDNKIDRTVSGFAFSMLFGLVPPAVRLLEELSVARPATATAAAAACSWRCSSPVSLVGVGVAVAALAIAVLVA